MQRELREGARRPFNYWLRAGAGAAGLLMVVYIINQVLDEEEKLIGQFLFAGLHIVSLGLICLVVPWMTADCISREKREGTLGLLFLTPLTAGGIVAGKGLVQALRALTLWVSLAPVLTIPFLMGGVAWEDATAFLALEFSTLLLCLAAGLLASTLVKVRGAAFVVALLLAAALVAVFCQSICFCFLAQVPLDVDWPEGYAALLFGLPWDIIWDNFVSVRGLAPTPAAIAHVWHQTLWLSPIPALLLFVLVLRFAAWRMANSWQDKIPSALQVSLLRRYCTPLFRRRYRRTMQRTLDWNPIAWLQQYSWKARLGKWGLCLAFLLIECAAGSAGQGARETTHEALALALAGIYTFAGINGFLEEKRSGALELLLVTPISVNKLIFGRVWGLWKQFLPAGLILAGDYTAWLLGSPIAFASNDALEAPFVLACGFLALPVFATYFALRVKNLIVAAVLTWIALWIPFAVVGEAMAFENIFLHREVFAGNWAVALFFSYAAFALLACSLLRHSLSRRIYSF